MTTPLTKRWRLMTLLVAALLAPVALYGAWRGAGSAANFPVEWMPKDFPARQDYDVFQTAFETGDLAVVSWPGCTVDDPRLKRFGEAVLAAPQASDKQGEPYFERVMTGYHVLRNLTGEPLNVSRPEALRRLQGSLVGPDKESSCAAVVFTRQGARERDKAIGIIRTVLEEECGIRPDDQHLAGPNVDGLYLDEASGQSLSWFGPPSAFLVLLASWWMLRSFRIALAVLLLAGYCAVFTLALMYFGGERLTAILIVMPPLVMALEVAGGVHLVNYFFDAMAEKPGPDASSRALAKGWLPCTLSAGTTAIGLASLVVSEIAAIRAFGCLAAAGVVFGWGLLLISIPELFSLKVLPWELPRREHALDVHSVKSALLKQLNRLVERHSSVITLAALGLMVATGFGLPRLQTSIQARTLFSPQSRILRDYAWLEENAATLIPIEIVLKFPPSSQLSFRERMELVGEAERAVGKLEVVRGTMSALTFMPEISSSTAVRDVIRRSTMFTKAETNRQAFVDLKLLHEEEGTQMWRVTARVSALADLDYGVVLEQARRQVEPLLAQVGAGEGKQVSAIYTGIMPVVHQIQRTLLSDLFSSFVSALALISITTMVVHRGVLAGLAAMIPNLFPIVVLYGLLGWLGKPVDMGSVMTASVALGMSLDGTLHFLTFFRRAIDSGQTRAQAVAEAYQRCALAMTESSLICGIGLMAFTLSPFIPASRFAWMILTLLALALISDLVVLPAILLGPAGRLFRRRSSAKATVPVSADNG